MKNCDLDRRIFLKGLAAAFAAGYLPFIPTSHTAQAMAGDPVAQGLSPREIDELAAYSHTLLPILPESHPRYRQVADKLANLAVQDVNMAAFIGGGLKETGFPDRRTWQEMNTDERTSLIAIQQNTPFFGFLRWTTTEIVMRDPVLWERLGYEGSAIEHGGYIHRGFDDIDWLPQATREQTP